MNISFSSEIFAFKLYVFFFYFSIFSQYFLYINVALFPNLKARYQCIPIGSRIRLCEYYYFFTSKTL